MPYRMVALAKTQKVVADKQHVRIKVNRSEPSLQSSDFLFTKQVSELYLIRLTMFVGKNRQTLR